MEPLWKFKGRYLGLCDAVGREPHEFRFRAIATELRGLLLEDDTDAANKVFQLKVFFPAMPNVSSAAFSARPCGACLNEKLLAGPPTYAVPAKVERLTLREFLGVPAVRLPDGSTFSLHDVVLASANLTGAVHGTAIGDGKRLKPLAAILFGPTLRAGDEILSAIARHVIDAYKHLFTLAEGASLGLAQPRDAYQPFVRMKPILGQAGAFAMEFAGNEFFEDGLPAGLTLPFSWVGALALRFQEAGYRGSPVSPMADRYIFDTGPCGQIPGPRFSIVQRGGAIFVRLITDGGAKVETQPVRLRDSRFHAVAAGVVEEAGRVRIFFRIGGGDHPRSVEAVGPSGLGIGAAVPSRMTLGAGIDRSGTKTSLGALMQIRDMKIFTTASERDIELCLQDLSTQGLARKWVTCSHAELRAVTFYNQMRDA